MLDIVKQINTTPTTVQLSRTKEVQERIHELKGNLSSGGSPDGYSKVSNPGVLISTSAALTSLDSSQNDCNSLLSFQQFTVTQLLSVKAINVAFNSLLAQAATSNPTGFPNFQNDVAGYLTQLTTVLNSRFHGESAFSGTESNKNAVINLRTASGLAAGSPTDTTYYLGNTSTTSLNLDATNTVTLFQVNATHPAIEKLVRALRIATTANASDSQDPALRNALDLTNQVNITDMGTAIIQASFPVEIIKNALAGIDPLRESYTQIMQNQVLDDFHATLMALEDARSNLAISEFLIMQESRALADFLKGV